MDPKVTGTIIFMLQRPLTSNVHIIFLPSVYVNMCTYVHCTAIYTHVSVHQITPTYTCVYQSKPAWCTSLLMVLTPHGKPGKWPKNFPCMENSWKMIKWQKLMENSWKMKTQCEWEP